jgi:hypothetical protein
MLLLPESLSTGGGVPGIPKCKSSHTTTAPGPKSVSLSRLTGLLATCTDEQFTEIIHRLSTCWTALNDRGNTVTKRKLEIAQWGAYRDDHNALAFQQTRMLTRQYPTTVTQYDTLLA